MKEKKEATENIVDDNLQEEINGSLDSEQISEVINKKNNNGKIVIIVIFIFLIVLAFCLGLLIGKKSNNNKKELNKELKEEVKMVTVPVASHKLISRTRITNDDVSFIKIPENALSNDYYSEMGSIIGKYVNVDTSIPSGSLFYRGAIVDGKNLPDAALLDVPDGETLYCLTINMLTSYVNSILPGRYIDIYLSTKENNLALVGKLFTNVKVLQVKTADGQNVFDDVDTQKVPYAIYFSLPEEDHLLLRKINAINNYSIAQAGSSFARIEVIPVPTTAYFKDDDKEAKVEVSSKYLKDYILNLAAEIGE